MLNVPGAEENGANINAPSWQKLGSARQRLSSNVSQLSDTAKDFFKKKLSVFTPSQKQEEEEDKSDAALPQEEEEEVEEVESHVTPTRENSKNVLNRAKLKSTLKRVQQECTVPKGTLAIHIRKLSLDEVDLYKLFERFHATFYVRISIQSQMKCTMAYNDVVIPSAILMDCLKHFRVQVSNMRADPENYLKIEVVAFSASEPTIHKVIATKEIHLYDIVKTMVWVDPIPMLNSDHKNIGELEVEMCFSYGVFGFGYSSQFDNHKKTTKEQVKHAMFCRVEPPEGREDFDNNVMTCRHVGHPCFIDFPKTATIGNTASTFNMDLHEYPEVETVEEPMLLLSKISKNMRQMEKEYSVLDSRKQRLKYLRDKISQPGESRPQDEGVIEVGKDYKLKYAGKNIATTHDGPQHLVTDVKTLTLLSNVLGQASGISKRPDLPQQKAMPDEETKEPSSSKQGGIVGKMFAKIGRQSASSFERFKDTGQASEQTDQVSELSRAHKAGRMSLPAVRATPTMNIQNEHRRATLDTQGRRSTSGARGSVWQQKLQHLRSMFSSGEDELAEEAAPAPRRLTIYAAKPSSESDWDD